MNKKEFIEELRVRLSGLPKDDLENRLSFYEESINDRMSDGKTEEEAIKDLGTIDEIVIQVAEETSIVKLVKEKVKPKKKIKVWEIALIICGFPVWFSLLLTASVLLLVGYLLTWVFTIVSYIVETSFAVASVIKLIAFCAYVFDGKIDLLSLGASIGCLGAAILFAFACYYITKGNIKLSKNIFIWIKKGFMRRSK